MILDSFLPVQYYIFFRSVVATIGTSLPSINEEQESYQYLTVKSSVIVDTSTVQE